MKGAIMKLKQPTLAILFLLMLALIGSSQESTSPLVGNPAPPLTVGKWVKGPPVANFTKGKIYVLDIWATWCGPCIGGIPHLTELQKRYASAGVVIIGLTGADDYGSSLDKVEALVREKGPDIGYRIAWDKNHETYARWMKIETGAGWPWCFVVDREGRIAFIGHPETLDEPLAAIVNGTYDLAGAAANYRARVESLMKKK
jgi:thiol-disulfide isomerase/thioredoxin